MSTSETLDRPIAREIHAFVTFLHAASNRDFLDQMRDEQLYPGQLRLLERLRGGQVQPTVHEAGRIMHMSDTGASRLVDGLAQRGYVRRDVDDTDIRRKRIVITPEGEDVIVRLHAARLPAINEFAERLTDSQAEGLHQALQNILHPTADAVTA